MVIIISTGVCPTSSSLNFSYVYIEPTTSALSRLSTPLSLAGFNCTLPSVYYIEAILELQ